MVSLDVMMTSWPVTRIQTLRDHVVHLSISATVEGVGEEQGRLGMGGQVKRGREFKRMGQSRRLKTFPEVSWLE